MGFPKYIGTIPDIFTPAVTVESPGYVYITVRINKSASRRNVYWHLVDPAFSLLELGFEWGSNRLTHISVPLYKGVIGDTKEVLPQHEKGEPTFDVPSLGFSGESKGAAPEVIKQEGRIQLDRSGPDLHIRLGSGSIRRVFSCQDQLIYGFGDSGELELISLSGRAALLK